jgi:site-specific DNA recombinase
MKAVIYARYSSDNQREESIDAQVRAAKDYASRNGIQIVRIYTDEARSATTDNRPEFLRMIKDSLTGTFNTVIVHKLDRFSRDRYDSVHYKRELKKNGVNLISVLENLDGSPESIILESLLVGMAEYYSQNLAREVRKGMKETALQCKHNGGIPPLGYDVAEDKTYVINELEAASVRLIFELYSAGYGYKQIVSKLKDKGYKTKSGKDFTQSSLHDILNNEKYIGTYIFNRAASKANGKRNNHASKSEDEIISVPGGMPAIIGEKLFMSIRERMVQRKMNARNKAKETYLLSGKIFCGQCNAAMIGHTSRSGRNKTKYSTYVCGERYRTKNCDLKPVSRDLIEDMTIRELKEKIFNPESLRQLADKLILHYKKMQKEESGDLTVLEKKMADIQGKIDNMVNAIADGLYNSSMKATMDKLEQEKTEVSSIISEIRGKMLCTSLDRDMIIKYLQKDMEALNNKSPEDLKKIIQTYVEKVLVYQDYVDIFLIVHTNGGGEGS